MIQPTSNQDLSDCILKVDNLNDIDTSLVYDMVALFSGTDVNKDISKWDTSNVRNCP